MPVSRQISPLQDSGWGTNRGSHGVAGDAGVALGCCIAPCRGFDKCRFRGRFRPYRALIGGRIAGPTALPALPVLLWAFALRPFGASTNAGLEADFALTGLWLGNESRVPRRCRRCPPCPRLLPFPPSGLLPIPVS